MAQITFREIAAIEPLTEFTTLWASYVVAHDHSSSLEKRKSLTNLFARIAGRHQERQTARTSNFRPFVKTVANGQEPNSDDVDRIPAENGKSPTSANV